MIMRLSWVRELYIQRAAQNLNAPAGRKVSEDYQGAGEGAMLATPRITRLLRRSSAPQRHHSLRVTCALRLVFMHEIDIHMGRRLRAELIDPCLEIDIGIAAAPQAEKAVDRGSDKRRAALICIGTAKRGDMAMQGLVDVLALPGIMAKFDVHAGTCGHLRKKVPLARQFFFYRRRQLE